MMRSTAGLFAASGFTAKERDDESGLDYFGARYYSGALGRFTSADAPFLDQWEQAPQSWNLYGYVRNNPLRLIDPTGQKCVATDDGTPYDDGTEGASCTAEQVAPDVIETVGTAGSLGAAIGYNLFFAFGNAASATFSPLFDNQPSSLRHVPLNDGLIGSLAGLGALAVEVLVGPPTNKVQITERGLRHAIARHTFYGPAKSTKSIFNLGESLVDLIKLADDVAPAAQANGNYVRVMTAGREIGIDRATGLPTKTYTVVTDGTGKLVTMFPGRP